MSTTIEKNLLKLPFFKIYLDINLDKHYQHIIYRTELSYFGSSFKICLHVDKAISQEEERQISEQCNTYFLNYYNLDKETFHSLKIEFIYVKDALMYAKGIFLYVKNSFFKRNRGIFNIDLPIMPTSLMGCILRIKGKAGTRKRSKTLRTGKILLGTKGVKKEIFTGTLTANVGSYGIKIMVFFKDKQIGPVLINTYE